MASRQSRSISGAKLPHYDGHDGYVFGGDELIPALNSQGEPRIDDRNEYWDHTYRSRIEQTFTRLARWTHKIPGRIHWRSRAGENTLVVYGLHPSDHSRIQDPDSPDHTFAWLSKAQYTADGNAIFIECVPENRNQVNIRLSFERPRLRASGLFAK